MNPREAQLHTKVQELETELSRLRQENALLRQKIDLLARRVFGCSSEKLSPGQLQLLLALAGTEAAVKNETPLPPEPVVVHCHGRRPNASPGCLNTCLSSRKSSIPSR